ncbi:MAG: tripartite tricarboxylate transporter TctB family protein [candidate division NC10 bacterium]|nr:tripartite tricarboxylate transporter TctB family protein [candidate division NC10 bacterium]
MLRKADRVAGVLGTALGLAVVVGARRLPPEAEFGLGAAFLPFWIGVVITCLSVALLLPVRRGTPGEGEGALPTDAAAWRRPGALLALLTAYVALLEPMGYVATTFGFLVFSMTVLGRRRWWVTVLTSGLATGALVALFRTWLKAPLPRGPWGL